MTTSMQAAINAGATVAPATQFGLVQPGTSRSGTTTDPRRVADYRQG